MQLKIPRQAFKMLGDGATSSDLVRARIINAMGVPVSPRQASRWKAAYDENNWEVIDDYEDPNQVDVDVSKVTQLLRDNPLTRRELSEKMDRSESSIQAIIDQMQEEGYNVLVESKKISLPTTISVLPVSKVVDPIVDSMEFTCAIPTDIHCGSKEEQITHFQSFLQTAREEFGVRKFLFAGDLSTGRHVYRGHELDVYAPTLESQMVAIERAIMPLPEEDWYMLGGNHDWSHVKSGGVDIVWQFCDKHSNVHYLGYDEEDVPLTDKVSMRLWHPTGGLPYATSYRLQKGMEALAFEQLLSSVDNPRVKIMVAGHLHVAMEMPQGGIYGIQGGCFEGRTSLLKRLGKYPRVGGYILTFNWNDAGDLVRVTSHWLPYTPIKNDYKNYPPIEALKEPDTIEYLYRFREAS